MNEMIFISALLLGMAGSLHCVGMCGPIAMSMPAAKATGKWSVAGHSTLYFLGKTFTYGILGALFGLLGQAVSFAGWQQALSIALGAAMILFVVLTIVKPLTFHHNWLTAWVGDRLTPGFAAVMQWQPHTASFGLGLLNGLLPCGLVYAALTAATATGDASQSFTFMIVFGIGTIPLMWAFLLFTRQAGVVWRQSIRRATPYFLTALGLLLILRGLDLGIPILSPHLPGTGTVQSGAATISCHPG